MYITPERDSSKKRLTCQGNARGLRICIPPTDIMLVSTGLGVDKAYPLGCFVADAPLLRMLSRMLFKSSELKCSDQILIHISILQVESVFITTINHVADSHKHVAKYVFETPESDLIRLLYRFRGERQK
uniref:Uncharacterized protein n=1 Tax=Glossina pallidipes TaxID=7398 RepID=A0A1B0A7I3_GLOPL